MLFIFGLQIYAVSITIRIVVSVFRYIPDL